MRRTILWATVLALVLVATGTTSYAASKYVITSSKQVKNGSLSTADLSKASRQQLHGATGSPGAKERHRALSVLSVPSRACRPGPCVRRLPHDHHPHRRVDQRDAVERGRPRPATYVVSARIQGQTGNEADPGNNFRSDCDLAGPGISFDAPHLPGPDGPERRALPDLRGRRDDNRRRHDRPDLLRRQCAPVET